MKIKIILTEEAHELYEKLFEKDNKKFSKFVNDKLIEDFGKKKSTEEIEKIKLSKEDYQKKYFFWYVGEYYPKEKNQIEELYQEWKKQDLVVIEFLVKKFPIEEKEERFQTSKEEKENAK